MKVGMLEWKLKLATETAVLIRARVARELTEDKHVSPDTFAELARHYSEREICDLVFLVSRPAPLQHQQHRPEHRVGRHVRSPSGSLTRVGAPENPGVTVTDSSTQGIKTVLHPVSDLAAATGAYAAQDREELRNG